MTRRFEGKVAIVTGAAGGIGLAVTRRLLREGAEVIAVDLDATSLEANYVAEVAVRTVAADITTREGRSVVDETLPADILVNAAGILHRHPTLEYPLPSWQRTMDVNLRAPFQLLRSFARRCIDQRIPGAVVNVCSIESLRAAQGHIAYTVSKTGLYMLTRAAALELAPYSVRVNAIAPGVTATSMNEDLRTNPSSAEPLRNRIPMGRFGTPKEQAAAVAFLASDDASYVTGAVLPADGGWTVQ
jgi:NAD(P)-dependent dehydrogenase (short-subunit alcohol dehydrogenase family)